MDMIIKLSDGSYNYVPENNKTIYYNFSEEIFFIKYYVNNPKVEISNYEIKSNLNK